MRCVLLFIISNTHMKSLVIKEVNIHATHMKQKCDSNNSGDNDFNSILNKWTMCSPRLGWQRDEECSRWTWWSSSSLPEHKFLTTFRRALTQAELGAPTELERWEELRHQMWFNCRIGRRRGEILAEWGSPKSMGWVSDLRWGYPETGQGLPRLVTSHGHRLTH